MIQRWNISSGTFTLMALHIGAMLLAALLLAMGQTQLVEMSVFTSTAVWNGAVWRLLTYPFYHNIIHEQIFFVIDMLMLYWFGQEVEQSIGRRQYFLLYASLVIIPAVVLLLLSPLVEASLLSGSNEIHFGLFIAFALLFPRMPLLFGIETQWAAGILLALYTLIYLTAHQWTSCIQLWISVFTVAILLQGKDLIEALQTKNSSQKKKSEPENLSVDAVLEKIARHGMKKLTPQERIVLEQARAKLISREKR